MYLGINITFSLLVGLMIILWSISTGGPLLAAITEIIGWKEKMKFKDKLAWQFTKLSLSTITINILLTSSVLGSLIYLQDIGFRLFLKNNHGLYFLGLLLSAIFFLIIYFISWNKLKNHKLIHFCPAILSFIGYFSFVYAIYNFSLGHFIPEKISLPPTWPEWLFIFSPVKHHLFLPFLSQFFLLCFGLTGIGSTIYFLIRRNKDDFGRDYYKFALKNASKWSLIFLFQYIIVGWLYWLKKESPLFLDLEYLISLSGAILLAIVAFSLWIILITKDTPLRYKGTIISAAFLTWFSLSAYSYSLFSLFSLKLNIF